MRPSITFKLNTFPEVSETFIVSNITKAIEKGYNVQIIANKILPFKESSQHELLKFHKLETKTISFHSPKGRLRRFLLAGIYILNPILVYYFIKYIVYKKKFKLDYLFELVFYQSSRKANFFHIHFANAAGVIPILKRIGFLKGKIIVTFHGYDAYYKNERDLKYLRKKYALLFTIVDKVTINTLYLKDKVIALGCPLSKIRIVSIGIDLNFYKPSIFPKSIKHAKTIKLISVGRLVALKGMEYGIRTVKILIEKGYDIEYVIIGNGILFNELKALINELNLEHHVFLLGKKTQFEIHEYLENSYIFLMVSVKDNTGREEAQGIVSSEAQAMGLPVLGFNSGGVPHTISHNTGVLVPQKETTLLADEIIKLINNENLYKMMSEAAREWVAENFNVDKMVENYYM